MMMSGVSYIVGCIFLSLMRRNWQCGNIKWNRYYSREVKLGIARGDAKKKRTKQLVLVPKRSQNASVSTKSSLKKETLILTCWYSRWV
jgi:hypothetical protein